MAPNGRFPPFSPVAANPLLHHRCDLLAPFAAVEDAVMADALRHQIFLLGRRQRLGERQRRLGLADSRYIVARSEEHTSELQSLMRISYAVFCLKKKNKNIFIQQ